MSRKDFFFRIKICRKESAESDLWLKLVQVGEDRSALKERERLWTQADEFKRIFASIAGKDDTGGQ